jgi:hypothetical protein
VFTLPVGATIDNVFLISRRNLAYHLVDWGPTTLQARRGY